MNSPIKTPSQEMLARWDRLGLSVRCAYCPAYGNLIRCFLALGGLLVHRGVLTELAANQRMLTVLLQTAGDEALPWFWRSVCIEHTALPQARLVSQLKLHDPLAVEGVLAAVQQARDALPCQPGHFPAACAPR
jgi:hypothetical protein